MMEMKIKIDWCRYKAFVRERKRPEWKLGDLKMKFSKLDDNGVTAARYFMGNKPTRT